ncbi:MAG: damage-control phosphatase ARMT1 family protein [Anaerolineales bacterium]
MNSSHTPKKPLPEPLSGSVIGSFAYNTITKRFPKIARETIQDNQFPAHIEQHLEQLIQDLPYAQLRQLSDLTAPDSEKWQEYLQPELGKNWLEVPWFFAEMYFYRRILEATEYYLPGPFQGHDPFHLQKERVLEAARDSTAFLAGELQVLRQMELNSQDLYASLDQLLVLNVWGNQADLSMWSASEERPNHQDAVDQRAHLLVNQARQVSDFLSSRDGRLRRVDFILDNFGPELIHDIGLTDYLLGMDLAAIVRFHAKPTPHYVSDAMIKDVHATVDYLANHESPEVRQMAERVANYIQDQRLEIVDDYFWTSPTYFWDMPEYIFRELSASDLVISKGDANYRRLAGDLNWPPTTPFEDVVRYFPTSLLALRVLKAELALGLTPIQVSRLDNQDPDWKFNGRWAVIQFWRK